MKSDYLILFFMCESVNSCLECNDYKNTTLKILDLSNNSKSILFDVKWNLASIVWWYKEMWDCYQKEKEFCDKINNFIMNNSCCDIDRILSNHESSYTVENKKFLYSVI